MPFNLFRRRGKDEAQASAAPAAGPPRRKVHFDGLSEEWRLVGRMQISGRLSDALNRREPIELSDMRWASIVDGGPLEDAPGLRTIDPYDLIMVLAGEDSLPPLSEEERAALRLHRVSYDVSLELPPYHVTGQVHLFPGTDPSKLLERASEMFMPVTDAVATIEGRRVNDPAIDTILVNRFYLRGVDQVETGSRAADGGEAAPGSGGPAGVVSDATGWDAPGAPGSDAPAPPAATAPDASGGDPHAVSAAPASGVSASDASGGDGLTTADSPVDSREAETPMAESSAETVAG